MKRCSTCNQVFDDSLDFCLEDGTRLAPERGVQIGGYETSGEIPTQYIPRIAPAVPAAAESSSKWLFLVIGLLAATLIFGGIGVAFLLYRGYGPGAKPPANETVKSETPSPNSNKTDNRGTTGSNTLPATPTPFSTPTVNPTPPPATPLPTPVRPRVTTSRIKFARGAVTSAVSGSLVEGETKNYVLACRAGQQMTASLSTSNRCITFTNGSSTISTYTRQGDNTIAVRNTCGGSGGYRINITIL